MPGPDMIIICPQLRAPVNADLSFARGPQRTLTSADGPLPRDSPSFDHIISVRLADHNLQDLPGSLFSLWVSLAWLSSDPPMNLFEISQELPPLGDLPGLTSLHVRPYFHSIGHWGGVVVYMRIWFLMFVGYFIQEWATS